MSCLLAVLGFVLAALDAHGKVDLALPGEQAGRPNLAQVGEDGVVDSIADFIGVPGILGQGEIRFLENLGCGGVQVR